MNNQRRVPVRFSQSVERPEAAEAETTQGLIATMRQSSSVDAPATGKAGAALDRDAKSPQTDPASKPATPAAQRSTRRRRLLLGALGVLVLAVALWFGIPYIVLTFSTVSTDDAYVNGHVTFVAARVHGQVSRVLVDDNYRVHKGDLLVQLDKEPFEDAVAVKKAAVDAGSTTNERCAKPPMVQEGAHVASIARRHRRQCLQHRDPCAGDGDSG